MPTRTSTSKKTARKPAAKKSIKGATKKRAPAKRRIVRMAAPVVDEPVLPTPVEQPLPEPQPVPTPEPIHEVAPVVSESRVSLLVSRLSFYLGVVTGAAVLHVLIFALVSIVNS